MGSKKSVPRPRGDEPSLVIDEPWNPYERVFPAHAGMNRVRMLNGTFDGRHVFPAHAGMNRPPAQIFPCEMSVPAHAGMNRPTVLSFDHATSVPRPRGDEPAIQTTKPITGMCSPPTRG